MEVLTTKLILQLFVALRCSIQKVVARNWNVPEYENMRADQNYPVHDELAFLLSGNPRL